MDTPKITALAPWFGGNRILAPAVGEELAGCRWVGVPFAGGMSELAHITAPTIVACDLHKHIINLARCVACPERRRELLRRLRDLPFHPDVLKGAQLQCDYEAKAGRKDIWMSGDVSWAADYFITQWIGRSGKAGTDGEFKGNLPVRWNAGGGDSNIRYRSALRSLAAWGHIMRRCNFLVEDAFAFLEKVKDEDGHGVYCDPPFPGPGDAYKHTFTDAQHTQLRDVLLRFTAARVVVRYYDVPLIQSLYPEDKWTWRRMTGRKQTNEDAPEVLLLNGPSYGRCSDTLF